MNRKEILKRLQPIFAEVFEDENIQLTEATTAADVDKWDSLSHLTLIYEVESEFGMKFRMKEILEMKNVGEMVDILLREIRK